MKAVGMGDILRDNRARGLRTIFRQETYPPNGEYSNLVIGTCCRVRARQQSLTGPVPRPSPQPKPPKMYSSLVRVQNVFSFFTAATLFIAALIVLSSALSSASPTATIDVRKFRVYGTPSHFVAAAAC